MVQSVLKIPSIEDIIFDKLLIVLLPKLINIIMYFTRV